MNFKKYILYTIIKEVEETGSKNDLASLNFKDESKKPKSKENKYSAKEIIFNI